MLFNKNSIDRDNVRKFCLFLAQVLFNGLLLSYDNAIQFFASIFMICDLEWHKGTWNAKAKIKWQDSYYLGMKADMNIDNNVVDKFCLGQEKMVWLQCGLSIFSLGDQNGV